MDVTNDPSRRASQGGEPSGPCGVILNGGMTGAVVSLGAVGALAERFRLRAIGGASGGAVIAALAAAAAFNRSGDGFARLTAIPSEFGSRFHTLFQPSPAFRPVFAAIRDACAGSSPGAVFARLGRRFGGDALLGALLGLIAMPLVSILAVPILIICLPLLVLALIGVFAFGMARRFAVLMAAGVLVGLIGLTVATGAGAAIVLAALLMMIAGAIIAVGLRLRGLGRITTDLPAHDYGLCSGMTQQGMSEPALTDWLTDRIDVLAGRGVEGRPLTFADLAGTVDVVMTATDMTRRVPLRLPLAAEAPAYLFRRSEFLRLFPRRVVEHLCEAGGPLEAAVAPEGVDDLYRMPLGHDLPLVVAARMSCAFPGLLQAIPLYTMERGLDAAPVSRARLQRWLFCDGSLSGGTPREALPVAGDVPVFAVSLETYDPHLSAGALWRVAARDGNVPFPPARRRDGIRGFGAAMAGTMMSWREHMRAADPAEAGGILRVAVRDGEGSCDLIGPDVGTLDVLARRGAAGAAAVADAQR